MRLSVQRAPARADRRCYPDRDTAFEGEVMVLNQVARVDVNIVGAFGDDYLCHLFIIVNPELRQGVVNTVDDQHVKFLKSVATRTMAPFAVFGGRFFENVMRSANKLSCW